MPQTLGPVTNPYPPPGTTSPEVNRTVTQTNPLRGGLSQQFQNIIQDRNKLARAIGVAACGLIVVMALGVFFLSVETVWVRVGAFAAFGALLAQLIVAFWPERRLT